MSSKERLREKEFEKKRASVGAVGGNPHSSLSGAGASTRPDPFLAETAISEEPSIHLDTITLDSRTERSSTAMEVSSPRPIPTRDSSLRKTGPNAKRSSARNSRSKRDSEGGDRGTIPELDESSRSRDVSRRKHQSHAETENEPGFSHNRNGDTANRRESQTQSKLATASTAASNKHSRESSRGDDYKLGARGDHAHNDGDLEDGAPSPAVSQGRRRNDHSADRNRRASGRYTPDPIDTVRPKRSNSKLKRLSSPLSPRLEEKSHTQRKDISSPEPGSNVPNGYERPRSADSIDDAVESYLCSPRLSQKIRHPQTGRVISFSEVGDSEGSAVFCCVGMGLTRYITAFYDELALTLKLRLITPDRPGVGDSEPYADGTATPLSWPG
jgi:hypothetical protein